MLVITLGSLALGLWLLVVSGAAGLPAAVLHLLAGPWRCSRFSARWPSRPVASPGNSADRSLMTGAPEDQEPQL